MKKIYFVLFISLLFNLFVGCASTSVRTTSNEQSIRYFPEYPQFDVSRYILPKPEERQFFVDNPRFEHTGLYDKETHEEYFKEIVTEEELEELKKEFWNLDYWSVERWLAETSQTCCTLWGSIKNNFEKSPNIWKVSYDSHPLFISFKKEKFFEILKK